MSVTVSWCHLYLKFFMFAYSKYFKFLCNSEYLKQKFLFSMQYGLA